MLLRRQPLAGVSALAALACAATAVFTTPAAHATTTAGATRVEAPAIHAMPTIHDARIPATQAGDCVLPVVVGVVCVGVGTPMTYGGGPIETQPGIYLVFWGWHGQDPSGEAPYQQHFYSGIGGSAWNSSQTQYCNGTTDPTGLLCKAGAKHVGNPAKILLGTWSDDINAVPPSPNDAAIRAEAQRAAAHFARTTAASNANVQYVIDTPHGNSTSGFGTQWCAYHGYFSSKYGGLSYTDLPYISDAGASCGEDFVNPGLAGLLDGVSIVSGHEFAESETDVNPPNGWTDTIGAETGDKCAWIYIGPGSAADVKFKTGTFPVQSLWSNAANHGAGGCTLG